RYTVFKLTDPARIIVDMPGVDLEKITSPITVQNEFLKDISAVSYGAEKEIGRLIIGLKDGVDHEVKSGDKSILVSLKKMNEGSVAEESPAGSVAAASSVVEEDLADAAPEEPVQVAKAEVPEAKMAAPAALDVENAVEPLAQATKILSVVRSKDGADTVIKITTNGLIGNFNSFSVDDPARIVVDIWTVENSTGKDTIKVKDDYIKSVRVGSHPDKTRLVFDASVKKLPFHTVKREIDSIVVTIGPGALGAAVKEAPARNTVYASKAAELGVAHLPATVVAAAEEPAVNEAPAAAGEDPLAAEAATEVKAPAAEAPAPAPPSVEQKEEKAENVTAVNFKKAGDAGRLTIVTSGKVPYTVKDSPDGKTVLIDIKGAVIPEGLHRTLDASKLKTPVLTISSYQEKLAPEKAARVLVKLRDKAAYTVKEENGVLNIDFTAPAAEKEPALAKELGLEQKEGAAEGVYTGKKIDIDMMDANVRDVLRLIAEISNLNIIASDDVSGTISLRLKNVPWDQAFDIILKSKGLDSVKEGNVVRVAPAAKIRQEKEAHLASKKAQQKLEDLEIEFLPVNYATSSELIKQIQGVLSDRGTVNSDIRTNTLIIKDVREGIDAAVNLVKKLDTPIPQVLIEARIVEATSSFARDLGIQWGVDYQTGGSVPTNTFGSTTTAGQTVTGTTTAPVFAAATGAENFAVNLPATGTAGTLGALGFMLGSAGANPLILDLRLSAGESEGRLKTISRPRVTTMDNKEAKIEQGESIPFSTTSAAGTVTTFVDASLSLTVTPHITPDGSVLMKIKATRNSPGEKRSNLGEPSINKKEASTEVLVRDGETTVIGGIVITDKSDTERGIPWLKDIPVLGWIFKNRSILDSQTELLIFITPTIIKEKITG
ncbi:MAG: type IV pilus secretin PilQ, partial [Deltaproteobacteria bacterium]|nr:type IV pilus secretin PilQ [Deltaproteobacteria bacterium]